MQVQRITNNNYYNNLGSEHKNIRHIRTPFQHGNNTNLVLPNAYYNQLSFQGGKIGNTAPEITAYMQGTIKPFLDQTEPLFDKASKLSENIDAAVREFDLGAIQFNPLEFKEVKRLRIDKLYSNKQEYHYLLKKSEKFFSTKETSDYAWGLLGDFAVPTFLSETYDAFCKMKTDTENGLKNINLKLYPKLNKKVKDVSEKGSRARMGMSGYTSASLMNKRFNELAEAGIINIPEYERLASGAENGMEQHYTYLAETEQAVNEAENLYQNGLFTKEDYDLLNSIPKRGQQVISRNAKRFNDIASKTQLSEDESKQLDDLLKRQQELITELWNKIEADKKAFFESQAEAEAEGTNPLADFDDNIPF